MVELRRWRLRRGDVSAAMRARRSFKRFARDLATASSDLAGAELIFGELAANGVEHSRGEMTLVLAQDDAELVLLVYHGDDWVPPAVASTRAPPPMQPRGRGLFFIRAIARRIDDPQGTPSRIVLPLTLR